MGQCICVDVRLQLPLDSASSGTGLIGWGLSPLIMLGFTTPFTAPTYTEGLEDQCQRAGAPFVGLESRDAEHVKLQAHSKS